MALPQDHVRAIDQLRTRLEQVSTSLGLLKQDLDRNDPIPSWPMLQADATRVGATLNDLAQALSAQRQLFSSLHAYPLPNFPGETQEGFLQQLLRKKLDPKAEDWIEESLHPEEKKTSGENGESGGQVLKDEEMHELWNWAKPTLADLLEPLVEGELDEETDEIKEPAFGDYFTIKERKEGLENVITGLKRDLAGDDDDDEEGQQMEEDNVAGDDVPNGYNPKQAAVPLETMLRFASGQDVNIPGA